MTLLITDPIDVATDANGDLFMDANGTKFSSGLTGIVQAARIRMRLFAGEWFLNLDKGVDWWAILGEKFDAAAEAALHDDLSKNLLDTPGILSITTLTFDLNHTTRVLTINWRAMSQFGDTKLDTLAVPIG
jgi:hypothetical protein